MRMYILSSSSVFLSTPSARRATDEDFTLVRVKCISIHALREEGDRDVLELCIVGENFYPRPPRGGRRGQNGPQTKCTRISIHALREEGDQKGEPIRLPLSDFYPRPPRGGRPRGHGTF